MRQKTERLAALATVLLLVLAGCNGAGGTSDGQGPLSQDAGSVGDSPIGEQQEARDDQTGGESEAVSTSNKVSDAVSAQQSGERAVIRTASIDAEVQSYANASETLRGLIQDQGGFVASSTREVERLRNKTWTRGRFVLRVPSENFSAVFTGAQSIGSVERAKSDRQDATDQLIDLNARIENLQAERDRLRILYKQANDTRDVLAVGDRLSDVQAEVEQLEARRQALRDRVAFSTVTVTVQEPRPTHTVEPPQRFHEIGLLAAFSTSVNGVIIAIQSVTVAVVYALPYIVIFGLPLAGLFIAIWRYR
jgi:hypothetical protein